MWFLRPLSLMLIANVDTLGISKSLGLKRINVPMPAVILISFVSSLIPFLLVYFGSMLLIHLTDNQQSVQFFGAGFLIAIGIYFLLGFFREEEEPKKLTKDDEKTLSFGKGVLLSLFLSVDDLGIFIAASVMGYSLYLMLVINFVLKILCFILGKKIANKLALKISGEYASLAAGILMIVIGWISMF